MASFLIHMIVGNEVNKYLKRDNNKLLLGSISPDIAKYVCMEKRITHFSSNGDIPNISKFLSLYKKYLNDDFVMGYYIHLYTDYLWFKYFIPKYYNNKILYLKDGTNVNVEDISSYIYNDYSCLNKILINSYNISLDFLNTSTSLENIIKEIPYDKINIIINECLKLTNLVDNKYLIVFDEKDIINFITTSTNTIIKNISVLK